MPMLRRPYDRRRDVRTRRPFVQPDKDRHLMIEIPLPLVSHRRFFFPLAYRQSGRALLKGAMRSPNKRQRQAKKDSGSGPRPAIQSPKFPGAAPSPFPERGFLLGRLSNPGLTVPRPPRARGRRPKPFTKAVG